jgi:wobble nucleotide-excising tRNase
MIESLTIADVATFPKEEEVVDDLAPLNFFFGGNGTGKTTLTRVLQDPDHYEACSVDWANGEPLEVLVYNRDFVEEEFDQSREIKGIFTLGKDQKDALGRIEAARKELDKIRDQRARLKQTLEGKNEKEGKLAELQTLEDEFEEACWAQKQKYDDRFKEAFRGLRNNREKFKGRVLTESDKNSSKLRSLDELESDASTVFAESPAKATPLRIFDQGKLRELEGDDLLGKVLVGSGDVDIAPMIERLGNSDWMRAGIPFYEVNNGVCPFCQQRTPEAFAESLRKYFDATFEQDLARLREIEREYSGLRERLVKQLAELQNNENPFFDSEKFRAEADALAAELELNVQRLDEKRKEPSRKVELQNTSEAFDRVAQLISHVNERTKEHNTTLDNLAQERARLIGEVWRYLLDEELKLELKRYQERRGDLNKAIQGIRDGIEEASRKARDKERELTVLHRQTTSVRPTVDAINRILNSFGFQGFSLRTTDDGLRYQVVRPDGTDAKETLSEGESSFVAFLYFYHLLRGSSSESLETRDRVVVIDDPVSSLDSDVLFIVGSLIRQLFQHVRTGEGMIRQVFVLTHNVYFHKEVTYKPPGRRDGARETYWIVRKRDEVSEIEGYSTNPVTTGYELLWRELRERSSSNLATQNIMRRILESYFRILGGVNKDEIVEQFEGEDQMLCEALFSWVNAGSHDAGDDLYVAVTDEILERFFKVFREVFVKTKHLRHFEMMMREDGGLTLPEDGDFG